MEDKETYKPRRSATFPAPTSTKSSTAAAASPVPAASFYATHSGQKPPPLPSRQKQAGSSYTRVMSPSPSPPDYSETELSPFREPQLVSEDLVGEDEPIPDLLPTNDPYQESYPTEKSHWKESVHPSDSLTPPAWGTESVWPDGFGTANHGSSVMATYKVNIDGRDEEEELHWWDVAKRFFLDRPGPGILPPLLADNLHHPEHSLFSVSVTPPIIKTSQSNGDNETSSSSSSSTFSPPPSVDEVTYAVPHPNAYYCRRHNGWVLLLWKSSSILPPLVDSFLAEPPLPDQNRRRRTFSCIGIGEQPYGQVNKTHHFHLYKKAVDARKLNPPFKRTEWELARERKKKSKNHTEDTPQTTVQDDKMEQDVEPDREEGDLLDLYVCCQCSMYCVVSDVIPGVIPSRLVDEFTRDRQENPSPGKSSEEAVISGWETLLTIIENRLWKAEVRRLPVGRRAFQNKIGWNATVKTLLETLDFVLKAVAIQGEEETAMLAPSIDPQTLEGRQIRAKLLRAWVEISAWLLDYQRRFSNALKSYVPRPLWVKIDSAREMYQTALGAHPDQIPRGRIPSSLLVYEPIREAWGTLGLTATSYSSDLLIFAYLAQCRCDPAHTPDYFTQLYNIVKAMQDLGDVPPQDLQNLVLEERSRFRYTHEDLQNAIKTLGFGKGGPLGVEFEDDVPEEFIADAWKDTLRRAWRDPQNGAQMQRDASDAFRMIAEARGSVTLRRMWEEAPRNQMDPSRAYSVLEVPAEVDDAMLLTVFVMRVEEQPSQTDKMREALTAIAEVRNSARLRQFLETGQDPGDILAATHPELPRGLNQLGNTCYLNSLLQYFYTIRELRDAIAPMANTDIKSLEDEKLSDDDLKRHRVGGRLVTRREIMRSKKFVSHLADLFWQMEYCETTAVTPTIDLAKLALVTSRDEEDEEIEKGGTDSSNDTDATLVEDAVSRVAQADSPSSILGKRARDELRLNDMEVDSPKPEQDDTKNDVKAGSPQQSGSPQSVAGGRLSLKAQDVEMQDSSPPVEDQAVQKPPPLPTRKTTVTSDSVMMFGRQHDVSECMDNCMFQIETALLKFDGLSDSQGKASVVKRLFYGKIRQRLTAIPDERRSRSSVHEKEDLFSHLPVNVSDNGIDIYDGLSGYFDDVVEYEGMKARMEVSLVELPPLLQIQLQRVQFNRETLQPYKSQAYVKFGETVYMDRFLDTADPGKKAKSKSIQAKLDAFRERLRLLTQNKHAPFVTALDNTLGFLSNQEGLQLAEIDEDLIIQLNSEQDVVRAEIEGLHVEIKNLKDELETIWEGDTQAPYELTSVFIHRGSSPSWGHYFFYSRYLPDYPDRWFKYNDSDVTEVSKDEVLANTTGSTANPYLLVFARKGASVIETVHRFDPMSLEDSS